MWGRGRPTPLPRTTVPAASMVLWGSRGTLFCVSRGHSCPGRETRPQERSRPPWGRAALLAPHCMGHHQLPLWWRQTEMEPLRVWRGAGSPASVGTGSPEAPARGLSQPHPSECPHPRGTWLSWPCAGPGGTQPGSPALSQRPGPACLAPCLALSRTRALGRLLAGRPGGLRLHSLTVDGPPPSR